VALKDEATYQYHVELGIFLVVVVILSLIVSFCLVIKKRKRGGGDSGKEDLKNILVDSPGKVTRGGLTKKSSFQYVDYRRPVVLTV
jgi:hypothetical protein